MEAVGERVVVEGAGIAVEVVVPHKLVERFEGSVAVQVTFDLAAMTGIGSWKKVDGERSVEEIQVGLVVPMGIQSLPDIEVGVVLVDVGVENVEEGHIVGENLQEDDMGLLVSLVMLDVGAAVKSEGLVHTKEEDVSS